MELRGSRPADGDVPELQPIADDGSAAEVAKPVLDFRQLLAAQSVIAGHAFAGDAAGQGGGSDAVQPVPLIAALGTESSADERAGARRYINAFHHHAPG
jgi:hypothetical protein